jgi:hypothetical protein
MCLYDIFINIIIMTVAYFFVVFLFFSCIISFESEIIKSSKIETWKEVITPLIFRGPCLGEREAKTQTMMKVTCNKICIIP